MLKQGDSVIRYYIIDTSRLDDILCSKHKSRIILSRPTQWGMFFQGLLRINRDLSFVRLPDTLVHEFLRGRIIARSTQSGCLKINKHLPIKIESWTLLNVIKFCIEGIQFGTFQRFLEWR